MTDYLLVGFPIGQLSHTPSNLWSKGKVWGLVIASLFAAAWPRVFITQAWILDRP